MHENQSSASLIVAAADTDVFHIFHLSVSRSITVIISLGGNQFAHFGKFIFVTSPEAPFSGQDTSLSTYGAFLL